MNVEYLLTYADLQQVVLLLWLGLLVLGVIAWDRSPDRPMNKTGRGATAFCKLHSRPIDECEDQHR